MASLLETLAALATAGTMMISSSLDAAAPQNDVDGFLFLQNRQWLASRSYEPETVTADVPGQIRQMRQEAALALEEMFDACKKDIGITLKAVSGYRSYARQETIYNNKLERVHGSVEKADEYVARPGASEHQTGLVMDVGQKSDKVNLTGGFGATKGGKWVAEHCWEYGFIIRYQKGWEEITGYEYEPWHVRYVGKENARRIHEQEMPLEEYLQIVRNERLLGIVEGTYPGEVEVEESGCVQMPALAEESEEYDLSDIPGVIIENPRIDPLEWNFALSLSDLDPELIKLANKECLLSSTYEPSSKTKMKLRAAPGAGTMYLQSECAEALAELFAGAEEAGYKLYLKSAYRAYKTQKTMYNNRLERNNGKDDGWVSKPGASDHQTGLGCDVVPGSWKDKSMNSTMASTPECQWMAEHCYEYGFVIRYPEDKQDITEINYEPWHLRYVGKEVARYIWRNGLCLEEFHEQLQAAIDAYLAAGGDARRVEDLIQTSAE